MPAHHSFLNTCPDSQVFDLLRHVADIADQNQQPSRAGEEFLLPVSLPDAPPFAIIARLLLHVTAEDTVALGKTLRAFQRTSGQKQEQKYREINPTEWRQIVSRILRLLQGRLKIDWKDGAWKVECSPGLLNIPEIRDCVAALAGHGQPIEVKNIIAGSTIGVGGNMHVGDVHYHPAPPAAPAPPPRSGLPGFVKIIAFLLAVAIVAALLTAKYCSSQLSEGSTDNGTAALPATPADTISHTATDTATIKLPLPTPANPVRKPRGEPMAGLVTDEAAVPLAGVRVSAVGFDGAAISDVNGQFRLYIYPVPPSHEVRLSFIKEGYLPGDEIYPEIPKTDIKKQLHLKKQENE